MQEAARVMAVMLRLLKHAGAMVMARHDEGRSPHRRRRITRWAAPIHQSLPDNQAATACVSLMLAIPDTPSTETPQRSRWLPRKRPTGDGLQTGKNQFFAIPERPCAGHITQPKT
jgi:hypothetical protein